MRPLHWLPHLFFLFGSITAHAHVVEAIFIKFETTSSNTWKATVYFDAGYALPEMRADEDAPQPKREWLLTRPPEEWQNLRKGTENYLKEWIDFTVTDSSGQTNPTRWQTHFPDFDTHPPDFPIQIDGGAYMRVQFSGKLDEGTLTLQTKDGPYPQLTLMLGEEDITTIKPGDKRSVMTTHTPQGTVKIIETTRSESILNFLWLGFLHVLPTGADHVLFILALFLYTPRWRPLLSQSLMFTIAHSLTLALMLSCIVNVSPHIIEPLIALSIAWVSFEHLFSPRQSGNRRLTIIFAFGLIHGLGFASSLREAIPIEGNWFLPLASANLGIELAQITVLGACLVAFYRHIEKTWFTQSCKITALIIGLIGLWWFIERTCSSIS